MITSSNRYIASPSSSDSDYRMFSLQTAPTATQPCSFDLKNFQRLSTKRTHSSKHVGSFTGHKPKPVTYKPPKDTTGRKTLVLDLDETLIHSSAIPPHDQVSFFMSGDPPFYVYKRPGLDDFLERVREQFEVFIFTHGEREYADPVLDILMPWLDEDHRVFRDSCDGRSGPKKDLKLFDRSKKKLILVDDSTAALKMNNKNTILIPRWMGTPYDTALTQWLPEILDKCLASDDVRKVLKELKKEKKKKDPSSKGIPIEPW